MSDSLEREMGRVQARLDSVEKIQAEMRTDLKTLLLQFQSAKGGWKTILVIGSISAAITSLVIKIAPFFRLG